MRPTFRKINIANICHNFSQIKKQSNNAKHIAVLKANAYGCGVENVCSALSSADLFAVASIDEAENIRRFDKKKPILLLEGAFFKEELDECYSKGYEVVISAPHQLSWLIDFPNKFSRVWFKIDSGMGRIGFNVDDALPALDRLHKKYSSKEIVLMTHFAAADEDKDLTEKQISRFLTVLEKYPECESSLCNTAGTLLFPHAHKDYVRIGWGLYGISGIDKKAKDLNLKPVVSLEAKVIAVNSFKKGQAIGYGFCGVLPQDGKVAVCSVGYADGYPRMEESGAPVFIKGKVYKTIGRVAMDMTAVLVDDDVFVGDMVELYGENIPAEDVCKHKGIINHVLLTSQSQRPILKTIK